MKVGIYSLRDLNQQDLKVHAVYEKILAFNGIQSIRLHVEDERFWDEVRKLSLFIMRFQHYDTSKQMARDILPVVENELGVPCYPNQATAWHYDDKVKQSFLMRARGLPMAKTRVFYEKGRALDWAGSAEYPVVFKLRAGAGSMNVMQVGSRKGAHNLIQTMFGRGVVPQRFFNPALVRFSHFNPLREARHVLGNIRRRIRGFDPHHFWLRHKNYALFQHYLADNPIDTRIVVIGDRAFAYRRQVRKNDFRASGSGLIDYDQNQIDLRMVEIAHQVSKEMGFQSMAFDFLYNEHGEPEFCEMSYNYGWKVRGCPGYWDRELNWHQGHFWPEYLHLVDGLGIPDLRMPELAQ